MSKKFLQLALIGLVLAGSGCSKNDDPKPQAEIVHRNLNNTLIRYNNHLPVDLDQDGVVDFNVTTQLTYIGQDDVLEYIVTAVGANRVLVKGNGEPARKEENVLITKDGEGDYQWNAIQPALVISWIMPTPDIHLNRWEGVWYQHTNKYLPVQLVKQGAVYNGWLRLSYEANTPRGIIVHDAAYNKVAGAAIRAGQKQ